MRSAEVYPLWPGIRIGLEMTACSLATIKDLGNRNGSFPTLFPMSRLYIAKGLGRNLELIMNLFPFTLPYYVTSWSFWIKWAFMTEQKSWAAIAPYMGLSFTSAFNDNFVGNHLEFGAVASKDMVRMKPYAGGGFAFSGGSVLDAGSTTRTAGALQLALHLYVGAEFELPIHLAAQLELMNLVPGASFTVSQKF
jgi:hypothetical protein